MQAYVKQRKGEEVAKHTGHFVPVEERKEVAKEIKRSHFTLGSDKGKFKFWFGFRKWPETFFKFPYQSGY